MNFFRLTTTYFFWHYTRALFNIVAIWKNFLWFIYHFFSIPTLTKTLFAPWRRLGEEYSGGFDLQEYATVLVVNALMRTIGALFRFFIIVAGVIILTFVFVFGFLFGVIWLFMPLLIVGLVAAGGGYLM